ncbi:DNA polymerase III subunit gamma and tau [Nocardia pneumoniae]|uniref:DNA polymerase III subunit gamma and tau n=1 Tax=Nocardia pneumoniae TaxID=228601 RepID=UPI0002DBBB7D|nr:DNA polymerase III subunit gamma and tau [Nocardia pneumoniae]
MALYRKYRPATFAEVVGQEHVTDPLSIALDTGRISHAYLFSGPRGCGKTSSARILARSLNCVQGPTSTPCGVCPSCVALGPGGPGNLDVIELDAASHGGVDDTRELRDRAFYAPAESRYRVFIVDEAHMVTTAGFNALLKIVEEPPAHLIFIFATTEPDKVLPTIRSRTHHYPFRLLPPATMRGLLGRICEQEQVPVEEAVYPLVIRAGGGSPRDSLSVLDQLLAGAGPEGVTYARAVALLGVTDVALIDDAVEALAADDGAALFGTVDRVMEAGHDPRRFAVDLLDRFRDLILLRAVPDATDRGLVTGPGDVLDRMRDQAERLGPATLTRYAELLHEGLGEMRGATAPRLLLEVVCARMLLPSVSDAESATLQRLERLERGLASGSFGAAAAASSAPPAPSSQPAGASPSEPPRRRGAEALAAMRRESRGGGRSDTGSAPSSLGATQAGDVPSAGDPELTGGAGDAVPAGGAAAAGGADRSAPAGAEPAAGSASGAAGSAAAGRSDDVGAGRPSPAGGAEPSEVGGSSSRPESGASGVEGGADRIASAAEQSPPAASGQVSAIPSASGSHPAAEPDLSSDPHATAGDPGVSASAVSGGGSGSAHGAPAHGATEPGAPQQISRADGPGSAAPVDSAFARGAETVDPGAGPDSRTVDPAGAQRSGGGEAAGASGGGGIDGGGAREPRAPEAQISPASPVSQGVAQPASAAAGGDLLREVEASWAEIRTKVREFGAAVQAMLAGASVSRVEGDVIVLAHQHAPLAQRLSDPRNLQAVRSAVRAVLGRDLEVRWEAGGAPPRPAAPRSGGSANRARTSGNQAAGRESGNAPGRASDAAAAPRFSRPSQSRNASADKSPDAGRSRSGGANPRPPVVDDDIPPPDYPDLPDDPGPADYPPYDQEPTGHSAVTSRGWDNDGVVPASTPEEEQEMMAAAADPVAPGDRRDPDEVALELLKSELGATRLDG